MTARSHGGVDTSAGSRKIITRSMIRRAIIQGIYKPGEKLTEADLATKFAVSRATVRETLQALVEEGYLIAEPYRGVRVTQLSQQDAADIEATRIELDMVAIRAILSDESGSKLAAVETAWREYTTRVLTDDPVTQHDAHLELHRQIWLASGNTSLLKFWPNLAAQMTFAMLEDQRLLHDPKQDLADHKILIDAIKTGDLELIRQKFLAHNSWKHQQHLKSG